MNTQDKVNQLINKLKQNPIFSPKYCDNCGAPHSQDDFSIVAQQEDSVVAQLSCNVCGTVQVMKMSPQGGMAVQRFERNNSDIAGKEFKKFAGKNSVNNEELLDVYAEMKQVSTLDDFLSAFQGN